MARFGRVLLPPRCQVCGQPGAQGRDLCAACIDALPWNHACCERCGLPTPECVPACGRCLRKPPPLERVCAAFRYEFPVNQLLPRFKFHQDLAAGRELAEAMRGMLAADLAHSVSRPQALIPVPLHPTRLRQRGYNQAMELARPLARAFDIPLIPEALRRIRDTAPQSDLGALARARNPRGAFVVGGDELPAHVALVDDVMTTGATLHACAKVLRRAGVQRVEAWVVARVPAR
ncbi:MAG: ComF family protein [Proteobacteria bacterium]|nr:ComF family protein [Pseudomonadota bacterium]